MFNLNLYLKFTIKTIKYKTITKILIKKFMSLFLNTQEYSSSINKPSFKIQSNKKTPKISKLNINTKANIVLVLIFLPNHFPY